MLVGSCQWKVRSNHWRVMSSRLTLRMLVGSCQWKVRSNHWRVMMLLGKVMHNQMQVMNSHLMVLLLAVVVNSQMGEKNSLWKEQRPQVLVGSNWRVGRHNPLMGQMLPGQENHLQ